MTFGEKIRAARKALNLSQTELSDLTGISERSLYTYEQLNTIPRRSNVQKLADALHVSVTYLMDEQETDPGKALEEESFFTQVRDVYGSKAAHEAQSVLERAGALFAGGDMDEEAKDVFMQSLMQIYLSSKAEASEKFTPHSRKAGRIDKKDGDSL